MSRTAIFIDGAYLDKLCHHEFNAVRLDFGKLATHLAAGAEILRTYYYDCPPYQSNPPTEDDKSPSRVSTLWTNESIWPTR